MQATRNRYLRVIRSVRERITVAHFTIRLKRVTNRSKASQGRMIVEDSGTVDVLKRAELHESPPWGETIEEDVVSG